MFGGRLGWLFGGGLGSLFGGRLGGRFGGGLGSLFGGRLGGLFGGRKRTEVIRSLEHHMGKSVIQITAGIVSAQKEPGKGWLSVLHPVRELIKA
ncbi:hypothetical protein LCGC14_1839170, partial [marine sediment metagenome]